MPERINLRKKIKKKEKAALQGWISYAQRFKPNFLFRDPNPSLLTQSSRITQFVRAAKTGEYFPPNPRTNTLLLIACWALVLDF